jgi:hypothetical protein
VGRWHGDTGFASTRENGYLISSCALLTDRDKDDAFPVLKSTGTQKKPGAPLGGIICFFRARLIQFPVACPSRRNGK